MATMDWIVLAVLVLLKWWHWRETSLVLILSSTDAVLSALELFFLLVLPSSLDARRYKSHWTDRYLCYFLVSGMYALFSILCWYQIDARNLLSLLALPALVDRVIATRQFLRARYLALGPWRRLKTALTCGLVAWLCNNIMMTTLRINPGITELDVQTFLLSQAREKEKQKEKVKKLARTCMALALMRASERVSRPAAWCVRQFFDPVHDDETLVLHLRRSERFALSQLALHRRWSQFLRPRILLVLLRHYTKAPRNTIEDYVVAAVAKLEQGITHACAVYAIGALFSMVWPLLLTSWFLAFLGGGLSKKSKTSWAVRLFVTFSVLFLNLGGLRERGLSTTSFLIEVVSECADNDATRWCLRRLANWTLENHRKIHHRNDLNFELVLNALVARSIFFSSSLSSLSCTGCQVVTLLSLMPIVKNPWLFALFGTCGVFSGYAYAHLAGLVLLSYLAYNLETPPCLTSWQDVQVIQNFYDPPRQLELFSHFLPSSSSSSSSSSSFAFNSDLEAEEEEEEEEKEKDEDFIMVTQFPRPFASSSSKPSTLKTLKTIRALPRMWRAKRENHRRAYSV